MRYEPDWTAAMADAALLPCLEREVHLWLFPRGHDWRALIARYCGRAAGSLPWRVGVHGKPRLADGSLEFNVSHSGAFGLLAVTRGAAVGVDVERPRTLRRPEALLARCFDDGERAWIGTDCPLRLLRAWTMKEALVKAYGRGIAYGLKRVRVRGEGDWAVLDAVLGDAGPVSRWTQHAFALPDGYQAALVCGGERSVRAFTACHALEADGSETPFAASRR